MSTLALGPPPSTVRAQREERAARARTEARARLRVRAEPLVVFAVTTAILVALGVRDTVDLHLLYPGALTRLVHTYIAWWNDPPRFRSIGFVYPPLQSVALLPFALLRPLATSHLALVLFSAICGGATVATLERTLALFGLSRWIRFPLLVAFVANPLFLDYGSNGMASCLVMALLAGGLRSFCGWYLEGADTVRLLGFAGGWLAIGFLARYETILWLGLIAVAVSLIRLSRRASLVEVIALEAIVLAPLVYILLIWSGVSSLVGGGGFFSYITREGANRVVGLNYGGRMTFATRAAGVVEILWRTSPLLLIIPGLLALAALSLRRPVLLLLAAMVVLGAAASVARMTIAPNPELLQPAYQMVALVPMLIGAGWLLSLFPGRGRPLVHQVARVVAAAALFGGLVVSVATSYTLMKHDGDQYDKAFTDALSSRLKRITPASGSRSATSPSALYADNQSLALFMEAAVDSRKTVLVDELAFPDLVLATDTTVPFRTRTENGATFWNRLLNHPRGASKITFLIVANPKLRIPGYPRDLISEHYPTAYLGRLTGTRVIYRNPLEAVVQVMPDNAETPLAQLRQREAAILEQFPNLPSLTPHKPAT